jgi:hypothetical protein
VLSSAQPSVLAKRHKNQYKFSAMLVAVEGIGISPQPLGCFAYL